MKVLGRTMTFPDLRKLREWSGVLTQEMVQEPGRFGLGRVPKRLKPDAVVTSVCGFCSTGCGLKIHLREGSAVNLSADTHYPVNRGMACPKGWEALSPLDGIGRATVPLVRENRKDGGVFRAADWPEALRIFRTRFQSIMERHGAQSVAFLSTGQFTSEEMTFLGALAKVGMGWRHGDSNTRQCMATAVSAYKESFGFDAPPYTYQDFEESDTLVFVGANPAIAHPILWQRVLANTRQPQIIVLDPRRTETAMAATRHYAIQPKSDLRLLYGLAHILIREGWVDEEFIAAHTEGFEHFARHLADWSPAQAAQASGLTVEQIEELARLIGQGGRVSFWWTMGVNQGHESTRTAQAIINLALMTGNIGKPGTGANSITGQCNAMGSRLFSMTSSLPGGRDYNNPDDRCKIAQILGVSPSRIPDDPGWAYDQIIDGIERGDIKGLWVVATNTAHSWINQGRFRRLADKLEFLVVQDMYQDTDTARLADLILPAAGWGEKEGTFINSERRIGVVRKVRLPPGQALSDFDIFRLIAHEWGCGDLFKQWDSPQSVFSVMKEISKGRPCDFSGIADYAALDECGGIQWPLPEGTSPDCQNNQRRLFEDGCFFTKNKRARFIFDQPRETPESPCAEYPFVLLTGRGSSSQWHTLTRTGRSSVLCELGPAELYVEIHPADARSLGVEPGDRVRVASRRGAAEAVVCVTPSVGEKMLFMPMHFAGTNHLTGDWFDPHSRQPSYKHCAVKISVL